MLDREVQRPARAANSPIRPRQELYSAGRGARICRLLMLGALAGSALAAPAPAPALAQAQAEPAERAATPPSGEGTAQASARAHFEAAMQHYRARRYREAIHEFEQSASRVPNAEVWFDIGRAHEQLGEYDLAIASYQRYLRDQVDAPDADELTAHIQALAARSSAAPAGGPTRAAPRRGSLAVDAGKPGAIVLVDGRSLGAAPIDRILDVEPGPHRIEASRAGYVPFRAAVDVQEGGLSAAYVDMQPLSRPRESGGSARAWTWIAAGASAAAIATAAGCGLASVAAREDGAPRSARDWSTASGVALGSALTFAIAATVLYFVEGPSESARASAHAQLADARR
jgi:tetratricopeptide (TPR) repeat protein